MLTIDLQKLVKDSQDKGLINNSNGFIVQQNQLAFLYILQNKQGLILNKAIIF